MASWQKEPETGQKLWKQDTGSGKITSIDYQNKIVFVDFFEKGLATFEFDELFGNWSDDYGGTWMLYNL